MTIYERYCNARDSKGFKDSQVAAATNIGKSTFSDWKSGRSVPKNDKLQRIAAFLNISFEYLMTGVEPREGDVKLTPKDFRDIKKNVDSIMQSLDERNGESLYYDGVEVELTEDNKELLRNALNIIMTAVKRENKEKYNPYKNKKYTSDRPIAAHNEHLDEPSELEKMQEDISNLKKPE